MNPSRAEKKWLFRQLDTIIPEGLVKKTAGDLGIPETIVRILALRGLSDMQSINDFLSSSLNKLPRPHLMKGMSEAVAIILEALKSQKPITVFGDFDADGVTSTAVLSLFFTELGMPVHSYIPDRLTEGYGLNSEAVRKLHESNIQKWGDAGVLITVDCGISDEEVVAEAKKLGFTVIITDHHKPPEKLPLADVILNPQQPECDFPCKNLAGVGVAFYLILGLRSELMINGHWPEEKIPNLKSYMDLVAIGTVADQVRITGCNRIIVKAGLEILNQGNRVGLQKLLGIANKNGDHVSTEDIAFRIAPRINAIGRMGSAQKAVELLTTSMDAEAEELANELENANITRRNIESTIYDEAIEMALSETLEASSSLVLYKKDWHQGVLGIVASRLSDQFNRPIILLTDCPKADNEEPLKLVKGSGRSIEGVDIHGAVSSCQEMLHRFGGHAGAVGLTLPADNISSFRQRFDTFIGAQFDKQSATFSLLIDAPTTLDDLADKEFLAAYTTLSPFGSGNPEPVFCMTGQQLIKTRLVGKNHLRFTIKGKGISINGIGFGFGDLLQDTQNTLMDIAFALKLNSFMGRDKWEINLVGLRPSTH
jgi:single-stranded-DNA-specific exonuclease